MADEQTTLLVQIPFEAQNLDTVTAGAQALQAALERLEAEGPRIAAGLQAIPADALGTLASQSGAAAAGLQQLGDRGQATAQVLATIGQGDAASAFSTISTGAESAGQSLQIVDTAAQNAGQAIRGISEGGGGAALAELGQGAEAASGELATLAEQSAQAAQAETQLAEATAQNSEQQRAAAGAKDEHSAATGRASASGQAFSGVLREQGIPVGELRERFGQLREGLSEFTSAEGNAALGTDLLAGGLVGLAAVGVTKAVEGFKEASDRIDEIQDVSGMSTVAIQGLQHALESVGESGDAAATPILFFQRQVQAVAEAVDAGQEPTGRFVTLLRQVGVSFTDLRAMNPDEQFLTIVDAISKAPPEVNKATLAIEAFGRGGRGMIDIVNQGRSAIDEGMRSVREHGASMEGTRKIVEDYDKAQANLNLSVLSFEKDVGGPALTALTSFVDEVDKGVTRTHDFASALGSLKLPDWMGGGGDKKGKQGPLGGFLDELGDVASEVAKHPDIIVSPGSYRIYQQAAEAHQRALQQARQQAAQAAASGGGPTEGEQAQQSALRLPEAQAQIAAAPAGIDTGLADRLSAAFARLAEQGNSLKTALPGVEAQAAAQGLEAISSAAQHASSSTQAAQAFQLQYSQALRDAALAGGDWTARQQTLALQAQSSDAAVAAAAKSQLALSEAVRAAGADAAQAAVHQQELNTAWAQASGSGGSLSGMLRELNRELADGSTKTSDLKLHLDELLGKASPEEVRLNAQIKDLTATILAMQATIANSSPADQYVAAMQRAYDQTLITGTTEKQRAEALAALQQALRAAGSDGTYIAGIQRQIDADEQAKRGLDAKLQSAQADRDATKADADAAAAAGVTWDQYAGTIDRAQKQIQTGATDTRTTVTGAVDTSVADLGRFDTAVGQTATVTQTAVDNVHSTITTGLQTAGHDGDQAMATGIQENAQAVTGAATQLGTDGAGAAGATAPSWQNAGIALGNSLAQGLVSAISNGVRQAQSLLSSMSAFAGDVIGGYGTTGGGGALSADQIAGMLVAAGARSPEEVATLTAIAMAESSGIPNIPNAQGSGAQGLFQFMPGTAAAVGLTNPNDPGAAAAAALRLVPIQGYGAWEAYTKGTYAQFLGTAQAAAQAALSGGGSAAASAGLLGGLGMPIPGTEVPGASPLIGGITGRPGVPLLTPPPQFTPIPAVPQGGLPALQVAPAIPATGGGGGGGGGGATPTEHATAAGQHEVAPATDTAAEAARAAAQAERDLTTATNDLESATKNLTTDQQQLAQVNRSVVDILGQQTAATSEQASAQQQLARVSASAQEATRGNAATELEAVRGAVEATRGRTSAIQEATRGAQDAALSELTAVRETDTQAVASAQEASRGRVQASQTATAQEITGHREGAASAQEATRQQVASVQQVTVAHLSGDDQAVVSAGRAAAERLQAAIAANQRVVDDVQNHVAPAVLKADEDAASSAQKAANDAYQAWHQAYQQRLADIQGIAAAEQQLNQDAATQTSLASLNVLDTHRTVSQQMVATEQQTAIQRRTTAQQLAAEQTALDRRVLDDWRALQNEQDETRKAALKQQLDDDQAAASAHRTRTQQAVSDANQATQQLSADRQSLSQQNQTLDQFDVTSKNAAVAQIAASSRAQYAAILADEEQLQAQADAIEAQITASHDAAEIARLQATLDGVDGQIAADDKKRQHVLDSYQQQVQAAQAAAQQEIQTAQQTLGTLAGLYGAFGGGGGQLGPGAAGYFDSHGHLLTPELAGPWALGGAAPPGWTTAGGYNSVGGAGQTIGTSLGQGVAVGIQQSMPAAQEAVRGLVQHTVAAAQEAAAIRSPSGLFADEVGTPMAAGIAEGVVRGLPLVDAAVGDLVRGAARRAGDLVRANLPAEITRGTPGPQEAAAGGRLTELPIPAGLGLAGAAWQAPAAQAAQEAVRAAADVHAVLADVTGASRLRYGPPAPVPGEAHAGGALSYGAPQPVPSEARAGVQPSGGLAPLSAWQDPEAPGQTGGALNVHIVGVAADVTRGGPLPWVGVPA